HGGLVHFQGWQGFDAVGIADGVGNVERVEAGDADDITSGGFFHFHTLKTKVAHDGENATIACLAVTVDDLHRAVGAHLAALDAANADHADVAVVIER